MAKLNWLVQCRDVKAPSGNPCWIDCGVGYTGHAVVDLYGNKGYQDKKVARDELAKLRHAFPNYTYRLIRITE